MEDKSKNIIIYFLLLIILVLSVIIGIMAIKKDADQRVLDNTKIGEKNTEKEPNKEESKEAEENEEKEEKPENNTYEVTKKENQHNGCAVCDADGGICCGTGPETTADILIIDVKDKELGDFFIDTRLTAFDNGKFTGKYSATEQEFSRPFKEATFALDCPAEQLVRLSDSELDDFITKVCDSVYDFGYDSEHLEIAARFNKENKLIDYKVTSEDEEGVSFLRQHNHWKTIQEIDR